MGYCAIWKSLVPRWDEELVKNTVAFRFAWMDEGKERTISESEANFLQRTLPTFWTWSAKYADLRFTLVSNNIKTDPAVRSHVHLMPQTY